jgi:hypothetical protein
MRRDLIANGTADKQIAGLRLCNEFRNNPRIGTGHEESHRVLSLCEIAKQFAFMRKNVLLELEKAVDNCLHKIALV